MTEILLLGTFHFMESSFDFYSNDLQSELNSLTKKIVQFKPDAIALEAAATSQKFVDDSYNRFCLSDLKNYELMKSKTLGEIPMFGGVYPITYNNEAIQIGYRLGKLLNLPKVYAIDDDTILDMSVMDIRSDLLIKATNNMKNDSDNHIPNTIIDLFKYYNSAKWSKLNHNIYLQANSININASYNGSLMVSKWYERNLKIFSNIQNLSINSNRLFILYGAGHLQILKELINIDENLKLVDIKEYL